MTSKHTPGPWVDIAREVMEDGSIYPRHIRSDPDQHPICQLESALIAEIAVQQPGSLWDTTDTKEANARLIAAAPDLLEALEEILNYSGGANTALEDEYVMDRIRSAIDKATGAPT